MTEAEAQAKQLDSVTDRFEEQEVDSAKALQAMHALSPPTSASGAAGDDLAELLAKVVVNKADVELICQELEVTEELAIQTLRQVAVQKGNNNNKSEAMVTAALRKLCGTASVG
jgi:HYPK UBA domain